MPASTAFTGIQRVIDKGEGHYKHKKQHLQRNGCVTKKNVFIELQLLIILEIKGTVSVIYCCVMNYLEIWL